MDAQRRALVGRARTGVDAGGRQWTSMRRRRGSRGTWLPNIGIVRAEADNVGITAGAEMVLAINDTDNEPVVGCEPLLFDAPQEQTTWVESVTPLQYITGNEYFLRRVVGKMLVYVIAPPAWTDTNTELNKQRAGVLVTAALFVARAGDQQTPDGVDIPIGGGAALQGDYNPDHPNCIREPWLWRRQWILGNPWVARKFLDSIPNNTIEETVGAVAVGFPPSNVGYGSVLDGPHVDAKTKRRVGNDDRLWWAVSAQGFPRKLTETATAGIQVKAHFDYRCFGSLRKARNRGTF